MKSSFSAWIILALVVSVVYHVRDQILVVRKSRVSTTIKSNIRVTTANTQCLKSRHQRTYYYLHSIITKQLNSDLFTIVLNCAMSR